MNDIALQKQIDQIAKELRLSDEAIDGRILQLRAEIDYLNLQMIALKRFLKSVFSDFEGKFPEILEQTLAQENPEAENT